MIDLLVDNLSRLTAALFLAGFAACYLRAMLRRSAGNLEAAIASGFSLSAAPTGLAFIACAFWPEYIPAVGDHTLSFIVGGAAILHIAIAQGIPR